MIHNPDGDARFQYPAKGKKSSFLRRRISRDFLFFILFQ